MKNRGTQAPVREPKVRINNAEAIKKANCRIIHMLHRGRPATIAYRVEGDKVTYAMSMTHPKDAFCKKVGTKFAVERMLNGEAKTIPVAKFINRATLSWLVN